MIARYTGKTKCPECHGTRLKPEASYVKIGGKSVPELVEMPVSDLKVFFDTLSLTPARSALGWLAWPISWMNLVSDYIPGIPNN